MTSSQAAQKYRINHNSPTGEPPAATVARAFVHPKTNEIVVKVGADGSLSGSAITALITAARAASRFVGEVADYAGDSARSTPPTGWLYCDGQAVSRTTYAALFAKLGTAHGVGDGSTTFNLPDCRHRVSAGTTDGGADLFGLGEGGENPAGFSKSWLGGVGGSTTDTLDSNEIGTFVIGNGAELAAGTDFGLQSFGQDTATPHPNVQPTILLHKVIFTGV